MSKSLFVSASSCLGPHLIPSPLIRSFLLSVILLRRVSHTLLLFISPYFIGLSSCYPHFPCVQFAPEHSLCVVALCSRCNFIKCMRSASIHCQWRKLVHVKHWYYKKLHLENPLFFVQLHIWVKKKLMKNRKMCTFPKVYHPCLCFLKVGIKWDTVWRWVPVLWYKVSVVEEVLTVHLCWSKSTV